eukprot:CAMPEP_0198145114 /NCGR_PEP_ID=MMETSP1443-20131203/21052_1 /TAXON_ID=186043 /ORGANISM="Entomoneis sp., Strain CCMP2396" /LENGTH=398 /DNA_ID=CAMNT_0043808645 /DNA_START=52 /DNA_END=1244 /DNA_ORIENTATION=+
MKRIQLFYSFLAALGPIYDSAEGLSPSSFLNRRTLIQAIGGGVSSAILSGEPIKPVFADEGQPADDSAVFQVYKVIPDSSEALSPSLQALDASTFLQRISPNQGGALWLGEHHNSLRDHKMQAKLLRDLFVERAKAGTNVAVGLEQVQMQFQPVLDEFIAGKLTADELKLMVQWDKRWVWPFEGYQEIFLTAQELGIPLIALNVNSEDLALVDQGGLPALPRQTLLNYVSDPAGFAQFASSAQFRTYVDYVIRPSYDLHLALGLLKNTMSGEKLDQQMSFRNFYSGRILWDETMANRAFAWTDANPGGLLIGLVGADHVKFSNGIPGRYARMATSSSNAASISVMLNPTLIDSKPAGSVGMFSGSTASSPDMITLQLRYLKDGVNDETLVGLPSSTGG